MKRILFFFLAIIIVAVNPSCVSKRYAKRGLKFEEAGLYDMAAQAYFRSLKANANNIDARIGLKKNGQRVLDEKVLQVHSAYEASDYKKTVYGYLDAKEYKDMVATLAVELLMPERTTEFYNDAKPRYLEKIYNEAQLLLEDEKFTQAEAIFAEIKSLEPGYGNTDELLKVSKSEPVYRQGKEFMNTGFYRKAYANFDKIIRTQGAYKDARGLKEEALLKAMITISVSKIENKSGRNNIHEQVESRVKAALNALSNPFVKVIDTQNAEQLINEQKRGVSQGSSIEVGKMLAAKAMLTGSVVRFEVRDGTLKKTERRGYHKEEVMVKDPKTGVEEKKATYTKVTYYEFERDNRVSCYFQYQLSSTETGSILVSDAMDVEESDNIHYATYEGNADKLVPGYWDDIRKDSPKDKVNDSASDVSSLRRLLKASKSIRSIDQLQNEVLNRIANRVASKIDRYNPEEK